MRPLSSSLKSRRNRRLLPWTLPVDGGHRWSSQTNVDKRDPTGRSIEVGALLPWLHQRRKAKLVRSLAPRVSMAVAAVVGSKDVACARDGGAGGSGCPWQQLPAIASVCRTIDSNSRNAWPAIGLDTRRSHSPAARRHGCSNASLNTVSNILHGAFAIRCNVLPNRSAPSTKWLRIST